VIVRRLLNGRRRRMDAVNVHSNHEAQIRHLDRSIPGGRLPFKVLLGFVALPILVTAVAWLDRPGEDTFQMTGIIIDIRTEVGDTVPPVRNVATIKLSDGTTVQCHSIAASSKGDGVIVNGSKSRLLGRRSITC